MKNEKVIDSLIQAEINGDVDVLFKIFLEDKELDILDSDNRLHWNWLHSCTSNPDAEYPKNIIEFYINHGVPINAQDVDGLTPLHYATKRQKVSALEALLEAGADRDIRDRYNKRPFDYCAELPVPLEMYDLYFKYGEDPDAPLTMTRRSARESIFYTLEHKDIRPHLTEEQIKRKYDLLELIKKYKG